MNAPHHHPSEAVLTDYAGGALRPAFAVVVGAHLEGCQHCRAVLSGLEALGGEMIADLPATAMADDALNQAMGRIERPVDPAAPSKPILERIPFGATRRLGPGISIRKAAIEGGDLLYLLRLPAGLQTVPHGHQGLEYTTILKGAYEDGTGVFSAGDFADVDPEIDHQPRVLAQGECICLIASEKPMRVTTWGGRLVHLLTGV